MSIQMKNWANALCASTLFAMGSIAMEPPAAPAGPAKPATTPTTTVLQKFEHDLQVAEQDVATCWSCFSKGAAAVDNDLNQATVTMLLLSKNQSVYNAMLQAGLNANNILSYQTTLEKILGVANLSNNVIQMIQNVINGAAPAATKVMGIKFNEINASHALLNTNFKVYRQLMLDGMTEDTFTNRPYRAKVMKAAGLVDNQANRDLIRKVLAKLSPQLQPAH